MVGESDKIKKDSKSRIDKSLDNEFKQVLKKNLNLEEQNITNFFENNFRLRIKDLLRKDMIQTYEQLDREIELFW